MRAAWRVADVPEVGIPRKLLNGVISCHRPLDSSLLDKLKAKEKEYKRKIVISCSGL